MRALVLAGLLSSVCGAAFAQEVDDFDRVVTFGDSLTDAGTYGARFTTNPGFVTTQYLAEMYGSSTLPALPLGDPANVGAWNYGAGGVGVTSPRTGAGLYVTQQVDAFLAASTPTSRDLILLQGGPNDIFAIFAGLAPGGEAAAQAAISLEAEALASQIDRLDGAGLILVLNSPDIGRTPLGGALGATNAANLTMLGDAFNATLYDEIETRSGDILVLDAYGFIRAIVADPARFGFANVTAPACTVGSSLSCTPATLVSPGADESYFFADLIHPTSTGHRAFADYAASVLNAPDQAVGFARSLIHNTDADRALVTTALESTLAGDTGGLFGGVTGASNEDDSAVGLLAGASFRAGEGGAYGATLAYDTGEAGGGDVESDFYSVRLTGFLGANISERLTLSGRLSGVYLNLEDVTRRFNILTNQFSESGDTDAYGYTGAIRADYALTIEGALRHGVFLELIHDALDVDGYAESGASPFALEYDDQELRRTSAALGYQIRYDSPGFSPFARIAYVEVIDSDPGEIAISLVNTPGTWSTDAPDFEDDGYARLDAGFSTPGIWGARLLVQGSASFQDDNESTRVFVGLTRVF